jgi:hypothetical protein
VKLKPVSRKWAAIINDISAGNLDEEMFEVIANIKFHISDAYAWHHKRCRV